MKITNLVWAVCLIGQSIALQAQDADTPPDNWFNLDAGADGVRGVSTEKAYAELLEGKEPKKKVVVAVIDSGVEPEHDDLKDVMWVNEDEIPDNGIDDDKNGYIDDIHGWNFLGNTNGENVDHDTYEVTRLYKELGGKKRNKKEEARYSTIKKEYEAKKAELDLSYATYDMIKNGLEVLTDAIGKEDFTLEDIEALEAETDEAAAAAELMKQVFDEDSNAADLAKEIESWGDYLNNSLEYGYNTEFNPRTIVGDDYSNYKETGYGNNDVEGPDAGHGTHVAGIIAATRGNDIGMDGVANNVEIMALRAVPNGDERDKDVANAIRYAVDNGADIVNMSFGKGYYHNKKEVDKAIKYAEKKGVLLVHAAGNSSLDTDVENNFPTKSYGYEKHKKNATNWLEVGALSWKKGEDTPAPFSNYGNQTVDLFAPGVDIYSTVPDNTYDSYSGTSMASPVVAGVAALVLSYYPELTGQQLREILLQSVVPLGEDVKEPGSDKIVPFKDLSITGGVVNVYKALELAEKTPGKRKK